MLVYPAFHRADGKLGCGKVGLTGGLSLGMGGPLADGTMGEELGKTT